MDGIQISKGNAYTVVTPPTGESIGKANAYAVVTPPVGLSVSKANAYAVVQELPGLKYVGVSLGAINISGTTVPTASRSFTTGNHIFVFVRWEGSDTTITLSDTAGNTYTEMPNVFQGVVGGKWFYKLNATGNASNIITATFAASVTWKHIAAYEFSGGAPTTITQSSAKGTTAALTTSDPYFRYGSYSTLLAGENLAGNDTTWTFSDTRLNSWINVPDPTYQNRMVAYTKTLAPGNNDLITFTGTLASTNRVLVTLCLDNGVDTPVGTTGVRVSQVPVEVLRTNLNPAVQTSQVAVEVLRINTGTKIVVSQVAVEVLRPNVAEGSLNSAKPVVFVCT